MGGHMLLVIIVDEQDVARMSSALCVLNISRTFRRTRRAPWTALSFHLHGAHATSHRRLLSPPESLRLATPPSFAFQYVSRRAHHTSTRSWVPDALLRRNARLPHPLPAHRLSSRSTAHVWPVHVAPRRDSSTPAVRTSHASSLPRKTSLASIRLPVCMRN